MIRIVLILRFLILKLMINMNLIMIF